ncbi:DUF4215 domain-containing protein, partial [candidate division KSB1 bacterium]
DCILTVSITLADGELVESEPVIVHVVSDTAALALQSPREGEDITIVGDAPNIAVSFEWVTRNAPVGVTFDITVISIPPPPPPPPGTFSATMGGIVDQHFNLFPPLPENDYEWHVYMRNSDGDLLQEQIGHFTVTRVDAGDVEGDIAVTSDAGNTVVEAGDTATIATPNVNAEIVLSVPENPGFNYDWGRSTLALTPDDPANAATGIVDGLEIGNPITHRIVLNIYNMSGELIESKNRTVVVEKVPRITNIVFAVNPYDFRLYLPPPGSGMGVEPAPYPMSYFDINITDTTEGPIPPELMADNSVCNWELSTDAGTTFAGMGADPEYSTPEMPRADVLKCILLTDANVEGYFPPTAPIPITTTINITECGDSAIQAVHEECDDGNHDNFDGCDYDCTLPACGNGHLGQDTDGNDEACDDGDNDDNDGCSAICDVEAGWSCDGGSPTLCTLNLCGNGNPDLGEECDDGNSNTGDACPDGPLGTCQSAACGDGFIWAGMEECDDANADGGDGCSALCVEEENWSCGGEPFVCLPNITVTVIDTNSGSPVDELSVATTYNLSAKNDATSQNVADCNWSTNANGALAGATFRPVSADVGGFGLEIKCTSPSLNGAIGTKSISVAGGIPAPVIWVNGGVPPEKVTIGSENTATLSSGSCNFWTITMLGDTSEYDPGDFTAPWKDNENILISCSGLTEVVKTEMGNYRFVADYLSGIGNVLDADSATGSPVARVSSAEHLPDSGLRVLPGLGNYLSYNSVDNLAGQGAPESIEIGVKKSDLDAAGLAYLLDIQDDTDQHIKLYKSSDGAFYLNIAGVAGNFFNPLDLSTLNENITIKINWESLSLSIRDEAGNVIAASNTT